MASKKCAICGKQSGIYPLCPYHNTLKEDGYVTKDADGNWVIKDEENSNCVVCKSETTNNNLFCRNCYQKVKAERNNFDHNRKPGYIFEHYYNLKKSLADSKSENEFSEKAILMWALAEEYQIIYEFDYLIDRVKSDILKALSKFNENIKDNPKMTNTLSFNDEDFRNKWPREHQCDDGHYVRSLSEMSIDNWLYNHGYLHAYEKSVFMDSEPDAIVLSDFYLPQGNVYIEYWGLEDNEKYSKRKEEKIKLYDENHYNRIDLYEKDIKRLNDILPRILSQYIKK